MKFKIFILLNVFFANTISCILIYNKTNSEIIINGNIVHNNETIDVAIETLICKNEKYNFLTISVRGKAEIVYLSSNLVNNLIIKRIEDKYIGYDPATTSEDELKST